MAKGTGFLLAREYLMYILSLQTGELAVEEGMALRLAFLQSASLRAICAIMNCTRYAEMLLVPKAAQEKVCMLK